MTATQVSARELFQSAYENRYTWDKDFPGYTADVTYRTGDRHFQGQARVSPDLKGAVSGIEDESATKAIENQLWEIAIHRVRRPFEKTHAENTFSYGKTDETGAIEILIGGKGEGDHYKLRDNEVCMVHRHIHGVVVTINTFSSHDTGAGYLSHRYDSVYHDPKTGAQRGGRSVFTDEYESVGDYTLLKRRQIETETERGTEVQEFCFSNMQLL
ncbi:MAG: DUF3386 domain-containing protein [Spirulinaceae cyanobacterium RM2_2_10]|nr:DUF3386 domain-containing protein [Spirulinaceae cyanobacterium SM2_1_0]NJO19844.1 DUF3386 domain-containing protein [Spirulinaceae cyanobacterium RM2_2_10]